MESAKKEIKLKRALILGNFYGQKVQIVQMINGMQEAIMDTVIGLKPEYVITKTGKTIPVNSIQNIYQL